MRRPRALLAALASAVAVFGGATSAVVTAAPEPAYAATSRAVVVVGSTPRVITFSGTITGIQALRKVASVSTIGYGGLGEAVCAIDGVGNPATPNECLTGPNGEYWAYFRASPGASGWQYSGQGAGATTVSDGWVEGWRYGTGGAPPFSSFCAVAGCSPPTTPPAAPSTPSGAAPGDGAPGAGEPGETTTSAPRTGSGDATTTDDRRDRDRDDETAVRGAASSRGGDGGDGGSPWGVVAGGIVVAGLGASGWWIRRSRRAAGV
jgi:hypothetical protein